MILEQNYYVTYIGKKCNIDMTDWNDGVYESYLLGQDERYVFYVSTEKKHTRVGALAKQYIGEITFCVKNRERVTEMEEYQELKALALKSAKDFLVLYEYIPDKHVSALEPKKCFLGLKPRTAEEMYVHTRSVNSYYFGEIDVVADNEGTIFDCRKRGFEELEKQEDFLENKVVLGSYDEEWSLRKVLRRFIWHDRIHGKAMYRMAVKTFGEGCCEDVFRFNG